jgi:monoterpene epsilon-lactone hydrolase
MASKQIETVKVLYRSWTAAQAANPNMSLNQQRDMMEGWAQLSGEPGGIDYIETEAGGVPAMWIVHEQVSVPVDLRNGKAMLDLKP